MKFVVIQMKIDMTSLVSANAMNANQMSVWLLVKKAILIETPSVNSRMADCHVFEENAAVQYVLQSVLSANLNWAKPPTATDSFEELCSHCIP